MGTLTVGKVRALTVPGRYGDGGTLHLVVSPRGTKSWVQRITIDGRRCDIGLGGWPVVSLAMARDRAFANRRAVADGARPARPEAPDEDPDLPGGQRARPGSEPAALAERQAARGRSLFAEPCCSGSLAMSD